jgi:epoxyqueuosine reductase
VIDNTRCISYHTIENRGPIPRELRPLMGDWVFGCDICQDVCPVNHRARPKQGDPAFGAASVEDVRPDLMALLAMTEVEFQSRFWGSAVRRAKLAGLQRNACVALGNLGDALAIPALARALADGAPLVRGHAAWALGRIGGAEARAALDTAHARETDAWVREEIWLALTQIRPVQTARPSP